MEKKYIFIKKLLEKAIRAYEKLCVTIVNGFIAITYVYITYVHGNGKHLCVFWFFFLVLPCSIIERFIRQQHW